MVVNMKSKYIMVIMVLFFLGAHASFSQTTKKKTNSKQKVNKAMNDSTALVSNADTMNNASNNSSAKSAAKRKEKSDVKDSVIVEIPESHGVRSRLGIVGTSKERRRLCRCERDRGQEYE